MRVTGLKHRKHSKQCLGSRKCVMKLAIYCDYSVIYLFLFFISLKIPGYQF